MIHPYPSWTHMHTCTLVHKITCNGVSGPAEEVETGGSLIFITYGVSIETIIIITFYYNYDS